MLGIGFSFGSALLFILSSVEREFAEPFPLLGRDRVLVLSTVADLSYRRDF